MFTCGGVCEFFQEYILYILLFVLLLFIIYWYVYKKNKVVDIKDNLINNVKGVSNWFSSKKDAFKSAMGDNESNGSESDGNESDDDESEDDKIN
jgi:hypothetical protein